MGRAALYGRDHTRLGQVAVEVVHPRAAVALTRGLLPKAYGYVDPNEDVVAVETGRHATLLVVADGHNGAESSEVAVATVLDWFGGDPPAANLSDEELVDLFCAAGDAIVRAVRRLAHPNRHTRTTLTVALLAGRRLQWAGIGDSALFVARDGRARELTTPRPHFIGAPLARGAVDRLLCRGAETLADGAWVVLATDGFTNFTLTPKAADAVGVVVAGARDPQAAARRLVDHAAAGGAGDNVAVAVAAAGDSRDHRGPVASEKHDVDMGRERNGKQRAARRHGRPAGHRSHRRRGRVLPGTR